MTTENPRLSGLEPLLGEWTSEGTHPYLPGRTLRGTVSFERIEGGAFVRMRSTSAEREIPSGVAIFGTDDAEGEGTMVYFDERGVSRRYLWKVDQGTISWWRDDPAFRQRFTVTVQPDGRRLTGKGQMSRDGKPWEDDLALQYQRVTT
ncbi:MAG TPA: hypothetical protein VN962_13470 [Polyangia bacterium]|nr:hypothetical protein [Polyangia bacterium]